MPTYNVTDPTTGHSVTLTGDSPPTEQELNQIFTNVHGTGGNKAATPAIKPLTPEERVPEWGRNNPNAYGVAGATKSVLSPILQALGFTVGGTAGAAAGGPLGAVAGAGGGYAGAERINKVMSEILGDTSGETIPQAFLNTGKDVVAGSEMEAGGRDVGPALNWAGGKVVAPIWGRMMGTGVETVRQGVKTGGDVAKAMRGEITDQEVVDNTKAALQYLKDQRSAEYKAQLEPISKMKGAIDDKPIQDKLNKLLTDYKVKIKPILPKEWQGLENNKQAMDVFAQSGNIKYKLDFSGSRLATDKKGQNVVNTLYKTVNTWEDKSASGLDTLKQAIDNTYSESSLVRQFTESLRDTTKNTIVKAVPQYEEMVKDYAEATSLVKDVESGLMLRDQGISGRVVADQTLRRLTTAMKDNFRLRGDLVNILSEKSGKDIIGQIAGNTLKAGLPHGIAGTGPALGAETFLAIKFLNPSFWPFILASSPRVSGEFLQAFGKALTAFEKTGATTYVGRGLGYVIGEKTNKIVNP